MQTLFGIELSTQQKVIVASVVILILLVLLGVFVRQIQSGRLRLKGQGGGRARQPRLGVVDIHDLDKQRQLILIRRDNVEHLVMIGGLSDVVIETNILRSGARVAATAQADYAGSERPLAFEAGRETGRESSREEGARGPLQAVEPPAPFGPSPAKPSAVIPSAVIPAPAMPAPAMPASADMRAETRYAVREPTLRPTDTISAGSAALTTALAISQTPQFARDHAPAPAASAGELDDMTRQLEEALKRPYSAVRSSSAPIEPTVVEAVVPDPVSFGSLLRQADELAASARPGPPVEPLDIAEPVAASLFAGADQETKRIEPDDFATPAMPEPKRRPIAMPVDVEAELELALGLKPGSMTRKEEPLMAPAPFAPMPEPVASSSSAGLTPAEQIAALFAPAPSTPADREDIAPVTSETEFGASATNDDDVDRAEREARARSDAAAMMEQLSAKLLPPASDAVPETAARVTGSVPEPETVAEASMSPQESKSANEEIPAKARTSPEPAVTAELKAEPALAKIDPFSVDAIEAEFARLLGREPKSKS